MSCVYILQSQKNGRYYIGSTNDLERRIKEHSSGKTKSLKYLLPLRIVFIQEFSTLREARISELKIKAFKSRKILEQIILEGRIKGP